MEITPHPSSLSAFTICLSVHFFIFIFVLFIVVVSWEEWET
jgi:hypothetical protein